MKVTKVEEMAEVEQETSLLDAPGGGAELLQQGIEARHRTPRPAEPAPAEAVGVGILSVAAAASSLVGSGSREMPIQCTVEESSDGVIHNTGTCGWCRRSHKEKLHSGRVERLRGVCRGR